MSENARSNLEQVVGAELIVQLYGLMRSLSLYDPNNDAITRLVDAMATSLQRFFVDPGDILKLQLQDDEFFVNGKLLKVDSQLYERASSLVVLLKKLGIGEVAYSRGVTKDQVMAFTVDLGQSVRAQANRLNPAGYGNITLSQSTGKSVASFRFQPERLAMFLYGGLLDLVDRLYEEVAAGRTPSLLPIKRTLQLVIDGMRNHSAIYQVLAALRDPAKPLDKTRMRVAASINAVGFGYYLGLTPASLMTLALGGLLSGLSDSSEPEDAVRPLFAFPGLGDSAMSLALAMYDTRAARHGWSGGVPGRILAVAEIFEELTAAKEDRVALAPHQALAAMVDGRAGAEVGPSRLFADYKGPYPLGSVVQLNGQYLAVVISHGDTAEGKLRPVVARLTEGNKLGERLDLAQAPDVLIDATPSLAEIGLNLAET